MVIEINQIYELYRVRLKGSDNLRLKVAKHTRWCQIGKEVTITYNLPVDLNSTVSDADLVCVSGQYRECKQSRCNITLPDRSHGEHSAKKSRERI